MVLVEYEVVVCVVGYFWNIGMEFMWEVVLCVLFVISVIGIDMYLVVKVECFSYGGVVVGDLL